MTPSNANTSGLEVVQWEYRTAPHRQWHITDSKAVAEQEANDGSEVVPRLVRAASAQARIAELERDKEELARTANEWTTEAHERLQKVEAAEARADRLAKALEPFARVARWARLCGMTDLEKATAKYAKRNLFWDQFSAADAALHGDADHAG